MRVRSIFQNFGVPAKGKIISGCTPKTSTLDPNPLHPTPTLVLESLSQPYKVWFRRQNPSIKPSGPAKAQRLLDKFGEDLKPGFTCWKLSGLP